jgi:hypothetical protein
VRTGLFILRDDKLIWYDFDFKDVLFPVKDQSGSLLPAYSA